MPRTRAHHPFLPNLDESVMSAMLQRVGAASVDDLFSDIPPRHRLGRKMRHPQGESE